MPIEYSIDKEAHMIFTRAWGTLTDEELLGHQRRLHADPAHNPAYSELIDFTQVERAPVSTEAIEALANNAIWEPGVKLAIIAPTDLKFGLTRMYQAMSPDGPQEIHVFRNKLEARAWLGLEGDDDDIDKTQD